MSNKTWNSHADNVRGELTTQNARGETVQPCQIGDMVRRTPGSRKMNVWVLVDGETEPRIVSADDVNFI